MVCIHIGAIMASDATVIRHNIGAEMNKCATMSSADIRTIMTYVVWRKTAFGISMHSKKCASSINCFQDQIKKEEKYMYVMHWRNGNKYIVYIALEGNNGLGHLGLLDTWEDINKHVSEKYV